MMSVVSGAFLAYNSFQAKPNFVQAKTLAGLWKFALLKKRLYLLEYDRKKIS